MLQILSGMESADGFMAFVKQGCFLEGIGDFDPQLFGKTWGHAPREDVACNLYLHQRGVKVYFRGKAATR